MTATVLNGVNDSLRRLSCSGVGSGQIKNGRNVKNSHQLCV